MAINLRAARAESSKPFSPPDLLFGPTAYMRMLQTCFIASATLCGAAQAARAQRSTAGRRAGATVSQEGHDRSRAQNGSESSPAELSESERALVGGSRAAIIGTGFTPAYFDAHFRVARVFDRPGDRRVVWTFSVGGYETTVADALGFYTAGGARAETHSVAAALGPTSDITRTITRPRAEGILRRCLGRFMNPHVEYRAGGAGGRASLFLIGERVVRKESVSGTRARERERREQRERARARAKAGGSTDEIESEGDEGERTVVRVGAVNLLTGECKMGVASSTP